MASLALLVTNNKPTEKLFTISNATSAATALCARLAAQLMATYPKLWPESLRALIVHSAQWTDAMRKMYLPAKKTAKKTELTILIRHCGWGTPDLQRALWSAGNSLTLIAEDSVRPFQKTPTGIKTCDMNLHTLPWPKDALLELGATKVRLRITLSYFIEPNPSARGGTSKFHYPSHQLRFDVQRPSESKTEFVARVNAMAKQENGDEDHSQDANWRLGSKQRYKGSLHQDEWEGTAADLANCGHIAVYPANGWWRTRTALKRHDSPARYSLIVSIHTEQTETDIYAIIEQKIASQIAIEAVV